MRIREDVRRVPLALSCRDQVVVGGTGALAIRARIVRARIGRSGYGVVVSADGAAAMRPRADTLWPFSAAQVRIAVRSLRFRAGLTGAGMACLVDLAVRPTLRVCGTHSSK